MTDIVDTPTTAEQLVAQQADEIAELRAEVAELRSMVAPVPVAAADGDPQQAVRPPADRRIEQRRRAAAHPPRSRYRSF
jgi:hypothetical protein